MKFYLHLLSIFAFGFGLIPIAQAEIKQGKAVSTATGIVVVARSYDISPYLNNKIIRIHFTQGQIVKKGALLVELDTVFKKMDVQYAQAKFERAKAQFLLAKEKLERIEKLKQKDLVSLANYREAILSSNYANANLRLEEIDLTKAKRILKVQKLYAPFDGQMSAPRYHENANVDIADGTEIATIVQLDPIHVLFKVSFDRVLSRMRLGETVSKIADKIKVVLTLPDGSTYDHVGKLITESFNLESETGMTSVLVEFPNPRGILKPGLKLTGTGFEH